ncbi:hypothetical protein, partial [Chitinophaga sp.]|uniref:hypothetical protein n=1 Tax=Chitinophaga sp. TaxID=1869181 RepID=UPI002F9204C7
MASYEIPEDPELLREWVKTEEEAQKNAVTAVADMATEIRMQQQAEQELMRQIHEITRKRRELEDQRDKIKLEARAKITLMEQAKRKLQTFESEKAINARY